jgi:hypothetical protein
LCALCRGYGPGHSQWNPARGEAIVFKVELIHAAKLVRPRWDGLSGVRRLRLALFRQKLNPSRFSFGLSFEHRIAVQALSIKLKLMVILVNLGSFGF